jgi:exodeoxyribonuclease VII small subunit
MGKNQTQTFEEAVERLESLVEAMESGQLALEEMLDRYEEGTRLVQFCSEKLAAAEKRIEIVTRNAAGKPEVAPFDPDAPAPTPSTRSTKAAKPAPEDEISLF